MEFSLWRQETAWPNSTSIISAFTSTLKSITSPFSNAISTPITIWEDNLSYQLTIDLLDRIYSFNDYATVSSYLKKNLFLVPLLVEAYGEINNLFQDASLSLEIISDIEDNEDKLYLFINSQDPNAYDLLDELDENWWLDALPRAKFKMNIDLGY